MTWKPTKTVGLTAGLLIGIMLVTMIVVIIDSLRQQAPDLGAVLSAVIMGLVMLGLLRWALYFVSLMALCYRLDRNAVLIRYGLAQHAVPLEDITDIVPGDQLALPDAMVSAIWPGYLSRQVAWDPTRALWVHGTTPLSQQIILITERAMYAISPNRPDQFIEDLHRRRAMGAVRSIEHATTAIGIASWRIWRDQPYWLTVLLALLLNLALFALNTSGMGTRLPAATPFGLGLLLLPSIGAGVLLLNGLGSMLLYRWERFATWLLLSIAIIVQLLLGMVTLHTLW